METPRKLKLWIWAAAGATLGMLASGAPRSALDARKAGESRFARLVAEARPWVVEVDVEALRRRLEAPPPFLLIDVREREERAGGRIPGSVALSRGVLERDIEALAPDERKEIVLYCAGGGRSTLGAESLRRMGYRSVFSLRGGYKAWLAAGLPIAREGA